MFDYLLGLFATDGSLQKYEWKSKDKTTYSVCLEMKDLDIIEKVANHFDTTVRSRVRRINNKEHKFYSCLLNCGKVDSYAKFLEDKPKIINYFKKATQEQQNNFMRGAFDGDGGICKKKPKGLRVYICANSKDGLEKVYEHWFETNEIVYSKYFDKRGAGAYNYNVGNQQKIKKLCELIYANDKMSLDRKKEIFLKNGFLDTEM